MATFSPPVNEEEVLAYAVDTRGPIRRLMKHYGGSPRGRNVFLYSDGLATEDDPDSMVRFWREDQGSPYLTRVFWSAPETPYEVTAAEAAALEDAGFTVDA